MYLIVNYERLFEMLRIVLSERVRGGITIINQSNRNPPLKLYTDKMILKQALINLMSNAIKCNTEKVR